jgi:tetratricopeptide (TPR) repeat protein
MELLEHPARGGPTSVGVFCTACGSGVGAEARFCASCGASLLPRQPEAFGDNAAVATLTRAQRLLDDNEVASAIPLLEELCRNEPTWASSRISLGIAYLRIARVDDAADALIQAEELQPDSFSCELAWAEYQARLGFYDRAVSRLDRALALEPPSLLAHTAAVELRRVCREQAKHLYYRKTMVPGWMQRLSRRTPLGTSSSIS